MPNLGYRNGRGIYASGTGGVAPVADTVIHGRAIYIGVAGNLAYQTQAGDALLLKGLPVGLHELPHRLIYGTNSGSSTGPGDTVAESIISFT